MCPSHPRYLWDWLTHTTTSMWEGDICFPDRPSDKTETLGPVLSTTRCSVLQDNHRSLHEAQRPKLGLHGGPWKAELLRGESLTLESGTDRTGFKSYLRHFLCDTGWDTIKPLILSFFIWNVELKVLIVLKEDQVKLWRWLYFIRYKAQYKCQLLRGSVVKQSQAQPVIIPVLFGKLCCVSIATPVKCTAPPIPHPQGGTYCPPPASIPRECDHCTASSPQCQPESQRHPSLEVTAFLGISWKDLAPWGMRLLNAPLG